MSHVVRDVGWAVIDVDLKTGRIFLQQRWKYSWLLATGEKKWSLKEKRDFHRTVDVQIWRSWSNRIKLSAKGTSSFCRRFAKKSLPMNLDVRWVLSKQHWIAEVTKVPKGTTGVGEVFWHTRKIKLNTGDLVAYTACNNETPQVCKPNFRSVPHEFGHTVGNVVELNRGDEYRSSSPHTADTSSIINIGKELRKRHFRTILEEMNKMIKDCTFAVASTS